MEEYYAGPERREFLRLPYSTPLAYKVCNPETLSKLLAGYTVNVSQAGLLCSIKDEVRVEDVLWLAFDKSILIFCSEIERHSLIYQNGVIGKVVRVSRNENKTYDIGIKFITLEEKDALHIKGKTDAIRRELGQHEKT